MTRLNMEEIYHLAIEELMLNESIKVEEYQSELESNIDQKVEEYYAMQLSRFRDEEHQIRDQLRVNYQNSIGDLRKLLVNHLLNKEVKNIFDKIRNSPSLQRDYFSCLMQQIPQKQEITQIGAPLFVHDQLNTWIQDGGRTVEIQETDEMGLDIWYGNDLLTLNLQTILLNNCEEIVQHILASSNDIE